MSPYPHKTSDSFLADLRRQRVEARQARELEWKIAASLSGIRRSHVAGLWPYRDAGERETLRRFVARGFCLSDLLALDSSEDDPFIRILWIQALRSAFPSEPPGLFREAITKTEFAPVSFCFPPLGTEEIPGPEALGLGREEERLLKDVQRDLHIHYKWNVESAKAAILKVPHVKLSGSLGFTRFCCGDLTFAEGWECQVRVILHDVRGELRVVRTLPMASTIELRQADRLISMPTSVECHCLLVMIEPHLRAFNIPHVIGGTAILLEPKRQA